MRRRWVVEPFKGVQFLFAGFTGVAERNGRGLIEAGERGFDDGAKTFEVVGLWKIQRELCR